ncbi:MAG: 3-oxoacyl-ACP reductase FabG [Clostridia bacterium]|jgi:3-oxoacyl-[acyl-carrier protein] reductase|nr:3-oxoacyl-ACP reductase FabG [Clostridia bacterium]
MKNNKSTVIITGASRGIGRCTAELFAKNGYNVLINYLNSKVVAEKLVLSLNSMGYSADCYKADVKNIKQVKEMVDYTINKFGGINVLVNNAGIALQKLFLDTTEQDFDNIIDVDLKGTFNAIKCTLPFMTDQKSGKIINISSVWGMVGGSCEVVYSAAKSGIIGLTKALAKELGIWNIQVNCVAPGIIDTDMNKNLSEQNIAELKDSTPLRRIGKPEEIAETILFLASDKANFITGQIISPNGGFII